MAESVPVPNWTPPVSTPLARPNPAGVSSGRADFESALRRADHSSRDDRVDDDDKDVEESDAEPSMGSEVRESRAGVGELAGQQRFRELFDSETRDEQALHAEGATTYIDAAAMEGPGDAAAPAATASVPSSLLMAETVAALMMRLERNPEAMAGRWQFSLVDDPAGISSLQLQRAINGSWKVSVSVTAGSVVDPEQDASELQQALEASGHSVESVEIAATHPDDESEPGIPHTG